MENVASARTLEQEHAGREEGITGADDALPGSEADVISPYATEGEAQSVTRLKLTNQILNISCNNSLPRAFDILLAESSSVVLRNQSHRKTRCPLARWRP